MTRATHNEFLQRAGAAIDNHRSSVLQQISERDLPKGRWHPNGFVVFHLKQIPDVGRLRLHFWPQGLRRPLQGHPPIHTHSWHLCSEVLAGCYQDTKYALRRVQSPRDGERGRGALKYVVEYGGVDGGDRLVATDEWFDIQQLDEQTRIQEGARHNMEPGLFHATPIPRNTFCSTLLVMSERQPGIDDVLVGNPNFGTTKHLRPVVTRSELELICTQFERMRGAQLNSSLEATLS